MNKQGIVLHPELEKAVMDLGFSEFTEIQEKCIPIIQSGKDVIGQSYTGSGKTAAFGFPMLEKVTNGHGLQALVLVPTRELCNQVSKELFKFSKYKKTHIVEVYGGVSINPQIDLLRRADVVVGTPGRMLDHMQRGTINLSKVKILILDEADKMFEMGFVDDVKRIISQIPKERQTLLFSATMSQDVYDIVKYYMKNPERVKLQSYLDKNKIVQHYYNIESRDKFSLLVHLLKQSKGLTLIFCATRHMVDQLGRNLEKNGVRARALHGGLTQAKRKQVMDMFHANKLDVLVASDVAARGLDIKGVTFVVNYDIPRTSKDYVHRIGRTARAGAEGKVVSLLSSMDHDNFRKVLEDRSLLVEKLELPQFERLQFTRGESRNRGGGFRGQGSFRPRFGGGAHGGFRPRHSHNTSYGGGHRESRYGNHRDDRRGGFGRDRDRRDSGSNFRDT
ncbi:TPA: DEAD/DEAH box helicase [Candidatus Woesearchaeota archaeon]|nr:DEAD/DEAH box helicase [Candidatus Woesearchaeota archaeon]HIH39622.1 DEAD/DEAH box helicase [Candidatus Woesearchaeota archaeon]